MATVGSGRRSHRKSKNGCLECKRRKVKCNEGKPQCLNCQVHKVECRYSGLQLQPRHSPQIKDMELPVPMPVSASTSISVSSPAPTAESLSNPSLLSDLAVADMELLHHYSISTCYTLSRVSAVQSVYRDHVPRIAFGMKSVLHMILAITALHLSRSDSSRRSNFLSLAQAHHNTAIRSVIPIMPSLASDQSPALFLFSSLTCVFACAKPPEESSFLVLFEHGHVSEWIRLFRGVKTFLDLSDDLLAGPLGPIIAYGSYLSHSRRDQRALEHGQMFLWEIRELVCKECASDLVLLGIYQDALNHLARTMAMVMPGEQSRLEHGDVFAWLMEVSDEYLNLLQQSAPLALIIFAYYIVTIRRVEWVWWMEGLSHRLMMQLNSALGSKYRSWLRWPQEQIGWDPADST